METKQTFYIHVTGDQKILSAVMSLIEYNISNTT